MVKHYSTSHLCPKPSAAIHGPTQTGDSEASTWTSGSVPSRARVVAWQQQPPPGPARVVAQQPLCVEWKRAVSSTPFRKSCTKHRGNDGKTWKICLKSWTTAAEEPCDATMRAWGRSRNAGGGLPAWGCSTPIGGGKWFPIWRCYHGETLFNYHLETICCFQPP